MEGRTWSLSEVPEFGGSLISECPIISERWPDPPAVVRQHAATHRSFVALSAQVSQTTASQSDSQTVKSVLSSRAANLCSTC